MVHLASGILGHFIAAVGCTKAEHQLSLLGVDLDAEDIDLLLNSGNKSLHQLLTDKHIDLSDIAPLFIPQDIPITPAPVSLPLPALPMPFVAASTTLGHTALLPAVPVPAALPSPSACQSSSPLSYIDDMLLVQPQPSHPISALSLGSPSADPLRTPTFRPASSPPVASAPTASMVIDSGDPPFPLHLLPPTLLSFKRPMFNSKPSKKPPLMLKPCWRERKLKCKKLSSFWSLNNTKPMQLNTHRLQLKSPLLHQLRTSLAFTLRLVLLVFTNLTVY